MSTRPAFSHIPVFCQSRDRSHRIGIFYGENPLSYSFPSVLLEISFLLVTIHLVRFLLKPLRQPKIVAEVIGGIIIGPSVLGRITEFNEFVLPKNSFFIVNNIGIIGFMYFLFVSGIKIDLKLITESSRKHVGIALASVVFPLAVFYVGRFALVVPIDAQQAIFPLAFTASITNIPSLFPILKEVNLLSSEVGQMGLSVAVIGQVIGLTVVLAFEILTQDKVVGEFGVWFIFSLALMGVFLVSIRKVMMWLVERSQRGTPIEEVAVILIILGALSLGFITDMLGLSIGVGSFLFGLVIPDGPPLGSMIVEKTKTFTMEVLMPMSFALVGILVDVTSLSFNWATLKPLLVMAVVGCVMKLVAILFASLCFKVPLRSSLALSLLLNVRGQVELVLFLGWLDAKLLHPSVFAMVVLLITLITGLVTPWLGLLYDPTKPFMTRQRRTIQHSAPGSELHLMMTADAEDEVSKLVTLLEASHPSPASPFSITALCLIELTGRVTPIFIDHQTQPHITLQYSSCIAIHKALGLYCESRTKGMKLHSYTAISPKCTLYQDICKLALVSNSVLIILLHEPDDLEAAGSHHLCGHSMNMAVLSNAPCSVGILVDKGHFVTVPNASSNPTRHHNIAVLFLGGADSREALAYADRVIGNPGVSMTVVRFLASEGDGDDNAEKKLDDTMVAWFWAKNENNGRLIYKEVTVQNGVETVEAIQAVNKEFFDLWIVGRERGINPVLLKGLSEWTVEHPELGLVGDYLAAEDFRSTASVLVVQQQVLREKGTPTTITSCSRRLVNKCLAGH